MQKVSERVCLCHLRSKIPFLGSIYTDQTMEESVSLLMYWQVNSETISKDMRT